MTHGAVYCGHLLSELRKSQSWPGRGGGRGKAMGRRRKGGMDRGRETRREGRTDKAKGRKEQTFPVRRIRT